MKYQSPDRPQGREASAVSENAATTTPTSADEDRYSRLTSALRQLIQEPKTNVLLSYLVVVNIFILVCRPQSLHPLIGASFLPLFASLPPTFISLSSLPKIWRFGRIPRAMLLLLMVGAIWIPLARNNFWAFHTFRDLTQQYFSYLFPIALLMTAGRRIRRVSSAILLSGVYLGLYSLTHGGAGPGGFLGDENDLCFQLVTLLGLPLFLLFQSQNLSQRVRRLLVVFIMLAGIVATSSRGGFLGLVAVLGYWFLKSPRKVMVFSIGSLLLLAGLAFVPESYWKEMSTISDTSESTAQSRIEMWKVATRVWLDPKHFIWGTGMGNTPYYLGDYEPEENKGHFKRSFGGRAVHSVYFQLLADLGSLGMGIFLFVMLGTLRQNAKLQKQMLKNAKALRMQLLPKNIFPESTGLTDSQSAHQTLHSTSDNADFAQDAIRRILLELQYLSTMLLGLNASLFGGLVAGGFISVLYYPSLWLIVCTSLAVRIYVSRLIALAAEFTLTSNTPNALTTGASPQLNSL